MSTRVAIIGGGFAGLTAAVRLSERGYEVLTGGTDNHIVLIHILARQITRVVASARWRSATLS